MRSVRSNPVAVAAIVRRRDALAADSVAAAIAETCHSAPDDRRVLISKQYASHLMQGIIDVIEGRPRPTRTQLPPETALLGPELIREVSRAVTAAIWSTLVEDSPPAERSMLLRLAERVFVRSQEIQDSALQAPMISGRTDDVKLRTAIAEALLRGAAAEEFARRANVRLAPSYIVVMVDRRMSPEGQPLRPWPMLEERQDVLAAFDGEEVVILVPALKGYHRVEVRNHAEQVLHVAAPERSAPLVVASAAAKNRTEIVEAVAEARGVLQVVRGLDYPGGVYQVDDVPIEVSLMRSPDLAGLLALRLVPLHSSGAPLLETLRVYLETSQDRRHAAAALHIHSNTLDYRLRRIRELTGLSPTVPRDIQTLGAALMAWRLQHMPEVA